MLNGGMFPSSNSSLRRASQRIACTLLRARHSSCLAHKSAEDSRFNILFLGRDEFSCLVLNELHAASDIWSNITIATNPSIRTGRRGSHISVSPLKILGDSLNLPVYTVGLKSDFKLWKPPSPFHDPPLLDTRHVLVTASFGRILPNALLDRFAKSRRLNVHPSLLPAYRGAAPIQHTIMAGEKETGVCVIDMLKRKEGIDAGGIWDCSRVALPTDVEFPQLRDILAREGGQSLVSVLRKMKSGTATSYPQMVDPCAPRAPTITGADSILDFGIMSAESILRRHRAISHQRPLITHLPSGKLLQLHSPQIPSFQMKTPPEIPGSAKFHQPSNSIIIRCAQDSFLSVPMVKQEGKSLLPAKEWWNGANSLGWVSSGGMRFRGLAP